MPHLDQLSLDDTPMSLLFLIGSGLGMTLGACVKIRIPSPLLSKLFGILVLATAAFVVFHNV